MMPCDRHSIQNGNKRCHSVQLLDSATFMLDKIGDSTAPEATWSEPIELLSITRGPVDWFIIFPVDADVLW